MKITKLLAIIVSGAIFFKLVNYANAETTLKTNPWIELFNGKDLSGWQHVGKGSFSVENNLLKTAGGMGLLWFTKGKFGNCIIKVVYKTTYPTSNSGVFVRIAARPKDAWYAVHHGYEVQILDDGPDDYHSTGAIYSLSKAVTKAQNPAGEWNRMEITLKGTSVRVNLNGVDVTKFDSRTSIVPPRREWSEPKRGMRPEYGYIGLQNEDHVAKQPDSHVYFKTISLKRLK